MKYRNNNIQVYEYILNFVVGQQFSVFNWFFWNICKKMCFFSFKSLGEEKNCPNPYLVILRLKKQFQRAIKLEGEGGRG